jgi:hypothetical protein
VLRAEGDEIADRRVVVLLDVWAKKLPAWRGGWPCSEMRVNHQQQLWRSRLQEKGAQEAFWRTLGEPDWIETSRHLRKVFQQLGDELDLFIDIAELFGEQEAEAGWVAVSSLWLRNAQT